MNLNHITTIEEANEALKGYDGNWLYLNGLTSAEGLKLPESIKWSLSLDGLTQEERDRLQKENQNITIY